MRSERSIENRAADLAASIHLPTHAQLRQYQADGFVVLRAIFSNACVGLKIQ